MSDELRRLAAAYAERCDRVTELRAQLLGMQAELRRVQASGETSFPFPCPYCGGGLRATINGTLAMVTTNPTATQPDDPHVRWCCKTTLGQPHVAGCPYSPGKS